MRCALLNPAFVVLLFAGCLPVRGQWQSLNGGVSWEVRAFATSLDSSKLLVGGSFPYVHQDSLRANGLAWWDGQNWSVEGLAGGDGDTSTFGSQNPVTSLVIRPDTIFAGYLSNYWQQSFELGYGSMLVNGVWQSVGSPETSFNFLETNDRLFNGGRADTLYGQFMPMVNEWVNGTWQPLPGYSFSTTALLIDAEYWQGQYYFGGVFNALDSRKIVAFDGVNQWSPLAGGVGGNNVSAVCGFGDSLYVGGFFLPGPDVQSKHLQIWDGVAWRPFFPQVEFVGRISDMQVHDGALYIDAVHTWAGDTTWYGLLRYDGHQLCSIGGPMPSGDNGPMTFFQDNLYLGVSPMFPAVPNEFIAYLPLDGLVPDRCVTISPTAVPELHSAQRLIIQPNPSEGYVQVTLPEGFASVALLRVMDKTGRLVQQLHVQERRIQVQGLADGVYSLEADAQGRVARGRVVVIR